MPLNKKRLVDSYIELKREYAVLYRAGETPNTSTPNITQLSYLISRTFFVADLEYLYRLKINKVSLLQLESVMRRNGTLKEFFQAIGFERV